MRHLTTALRTLLIGIKINLSDGRRHPIAGLFLIIVGLLNLCKPEEMWYMSTGWRFKDAEPSEDALLWCRVSGVISIIIGLILLL